MLRERLVAEGCTRRAGDQLGVIAACHWAMTTDPVYDPSEASPETFDEALRPVRLPVPLSGGYLQPS